MQGRGYRKENERRNRVDIGRPKKGSKEGRMEGYTHTPASSLLPARILCQLVLLFKADLPMKDVSATVEN